LATLAIAKAPDFEDAYWLRGCAIRARNVEQCVTDVREALRLNELARRRLKTELDLLGDRPTCVPSITETALREREARRITELELLVAALAQRGDLQPALEAVDVLLSLEPERSDAIAKRQLLRNLVAKPRPGPES
jgi:tetratricopeptide (TPR) repeat protein